MKRFLAWILLCATAVGLMGCGGATAPAETTVPTAEVTAAETAPPEITEAVEMTVQTEPAALEGSLFLKVSSIDFSLVGETEDIYLGLIPRGQVIWESDDANVVSVDNGVLTATGVGKTTVRAIYGDQTAVISVGCLAQTQEELEALDPAVLAAPKRLPPQINLEQPCTYFDNAAIVGDSITYFLFQWESKTNYLGNMLFLARGGVSMQGFVHRFKNIYYRGKEMNLEDAIAKSQVDRVYFLMGSNDISAKTQRPHLFENWTIMLERIREKHPDVEILLMSNIPEYDPGDYADGKNDLIREYNINLRQFAQDNNCLFLDLYYYVEDHCGRMPELYKQGNYHMNEAGCLNWMKILRFYAQYESEGGSFV